MQRQLGSFASSRRSDENFALARHDRLRQSHHLVQQIETPLSFCVCSAENELERLDSAIHAFRDRLRAADIRKLILIISLELPLHKTGEK